MHRLKDHFSVGQVIANRRHDDHREHLYRYVVRKRSDLLSVIIPFFREHQLRTQKREDFDRFALCVALMSEGGHRTQEGLIEILETMQLMNRKKSRQDLIRILRDHTPDIRTDG